MTAYAFTSGGFPSSPSSGDSLVINGLFYDWTGTTWKVRSVTSKRVEFIATANQATKTGLTYFVGSIDCYINGAKMLLGTDFTATDGTSVTFTPALDLDDEVQLIMDATASASAGASSLASLSDTTVATTDPLVASNPSVVGHVWVNSTTGQAYICTDISTNNNVWKNIGNGTEDVISPFTATGGTITTVGAYTVHTFTTSGNFAVSNSGASGVVDYLVVAGGGSGGGGRHGAGAGAGGFRTATAYAVNASSYSIVVGAGASGVGATAGTVGSSSSFSGITSIGGGGGGCYEGGGGIINGDNGGSGGGAGYAGSVGSGTSGQGNNGGAMSTAASAYGCGGGGGAFAVGGNGSGTSGGDGGSGINSSITGSSSTYAGGGGGSAWSYVSAAGSGGSGGGGDGTSANNTGGHGSINRGAGGGGSAGSSNASAGGNGGSGIVIIRYLT